MQISIRTGLLIGIVALVGGTAALVHLPWQAASRSNIDELDQRINALAIESVDSKIDRLLEDAVAARRAVAENIGGGATDIENRARAEALLLAVLQSQPNLAAIEFGWDDDRSLRLRRLPDGAIRAEYTEPTNAAAVQDSRTYRFSADGLKMPTQSAIDPSTYLVTEQFWYKNAFTQDTPVWSNVSRLPPSGVFGVTNAQTLEHDGQVFGVLGVSIALDTLSRFLDGVTVGRHGSVFLGNIYGQLVAAPKTMLAGENGGDDAGAPVALPRLDQSPIPAVHVVAATLKANGIDLMALGGTRQFTYRLPESGESYFVTLAPLAQMGLVVAVVLPSAEVLASIDKNTQRLLIGLAAFVVVVLILGTLAARTLIGRPLHRMADNLRELGDFRFERIGAVPSIFTELREVSGATARMAASLSSFKKYIPTELVRTLFAQGIEAKLGGEMKELSILFMDLAGFTGLSETLGDRLTLVLGDYFSAMSATIQKEHGTIDKYIGDAIMAFWGAPVPDAEHALHACRAALACQAQLAALRQTGGTMAGLRARIGINTGTVLVGNIGSHDRINYSVIGDPVNVASRLESLNKAYGTEILIGADTYALVKERVIARCLDTVAVYGRASGLDVYEPIGCIDSESTQIPEWIIVYESGLVRLKNRDWDAAIALFRRVIALRGADGPAELQIERAEAYKVSPPPPDWDGLIVMATK